MEKEETMVDRIELTTYLDEKTNTEKKE